MAEVLFLLFYQFRQRLDGLQEGFCHNPNHFIWGWQLVTVGRLVCSHPWQPIIINHFKEKLTWVCEEFLGSGKKQRWRHCLTWDGISLKKELPSFNLYKQSNQSWAKIWKLTGKRYLFMLMKPFIRFVEVLVKTWLATYLQTKSEAW